MQDTLNAIHEDHVSLLRLCAAVEGVAAPGCLYGAKEAALFDAVFDYLEAFVDATHHRKEDDCLYRLLRARSDRAAAILDPLQRDHRESPEQLRALRAGLRETTAGQRTPETFTADIHFYFDSLRRHMVDEERLVFPLARECLQAPDWAECRQAFLDPSDPRFGARAQAHLRDLFHRISNLAPEAVGLASPSAGTLQTPAPALLEARAITSFYGQIQALKGIDLAIHQGEVVALVGANGAGKSTFLRALSGVQTVRSGSIEFCGEDITRLHASRRVRLGICQSPEGREIFGELSIEDNLRLGAYARPGRATSTDLDRIYALFPVLAQRRANQAGSLSGGQQQMLAIGRALMGHPRLLLLDEPSLGLAPLLVEEVFNVIRQLKSEGMTILLVEQNAFAALSLADRGYVLETGRITLQGRGDELLNNPNIRTAYLGM